MIPAAGGLNRVVPATRPEQLAYLPGPLHVSHVESMGRSSGSRFGRGRGTCVWQVWSGLRLSTPWLRGSSLEGTQQGARDSGLGSAPHAGIVAVGVRTPIEVNPRLRVGEFVGNLGR